MYFLINKLFLSDRSIIQANPNIFAFAFFTNFAHSKLDFPVVITSSTMRTFAFLLIEKPLLSLNFPSTLSKNIASLFNNFPKTKKTAILFGPEQSGLSNNDLMLCDCIFTIPSSNKNKSLNLSHSVLIMAYKWQEYFKNFKLADSTNEEISDKKNFDMFMIFLKKELNNIGFLYPKEKSENMFNNIQSMFLRANLSKKEIKTLWGMIKMFQNPIKR